MRGIGWLGVVGIVTVGCKPAEEAPPADTDATYSMADAATYVFSGFEGDEAELATALLDLERAMGAVDLTASDPKDRAYTIDKLTADELGGATAPPGADPANQIASLVLGLSNKDIAANDTLVLETNQVCIESNTTVYYERTFTSDTGCFTDGSCDILRSTNEVRKENLLAKAWYDLYKDFRHVDLGDGRVALISRSWADKSYKGDNEANEFTQTFTSEIWIPSGTETLRAYAMWAEIKIGIGADALQNIIIDGIDEGMQNADKFLDGDMSYCRLDRDRPYDRPQE